MLRLARASLFFYCSKSSSPFCCILMRRTYGKESNFVLICETNDSAKQQNLCEIKQDIDMFALISAGVARFFILSKKSVISHFFTKINPYGEKRYPFPIVISFCLRYNIRICIQINLIFRNERIYYETYHHQRALRFPRSVR